MSKKKNRIFYKPRWVTLNNRYITSVRDIGMTLDFDLEQCFCSCPFPLGLETTTHYEDCCNADPQKFVRYVTKEERGLL
jgi:hypothetical protein